MHLKNRVPSQSQSDLHKRFPGKFGQGKHAGRATAAAHVIRHGHVGGIWTGIVQVSTPLS